MALDMTRSGVSTAHQGCCCNVFVGLVIVAILRLTKYIVVHKRLQKSFLSRGSPAVMPFFLHVLTSRLGLLFSLQDRLCL